jgi:hypothetical protein
MENINKKALDDDLNIEKGEELSRPPRKFIPVPKVNRSKEKPKNDGKTKR